MTRAGVKPTTLWLKVIDSTKAPSHPTSIFPINDYCIVLLLFSIHSSLHPQSWTAVQGPSYKESGPAVLTLLVVPSMDLHLLLITAVAHSIPNIQNQCPAHVCLELAASTTNTVHVSN